MAYSAFQADRIRRRFRHHKFVEKPMDFTGRVMRGFLFVDAVGFDSDEDLDFWVERALEFNVLLTKAQP
jgi:hypothetical protein